VAVGVGALYFAQHDAEHTAARAVARLHLHPSNAYVERATAWVVSTDPRTLRAIGLGTFTYAAIFITEGVGLLLQKRWAEYFAVIVTTSFLPLEVYELVERARLSRLAIVAANLAIVLYLIFRLRSPLRRA
jgi:uncharacterized membrane protein (DUF2068 family)